MPRSRAQARYIATMRGRELRVAVDAQRGVGGLAGLQRVERLAEQEHALGGAADELGRRAAGGADAVHQRARAAQAGLDPVAQLDARRAPRSGRRPPRSPARRAAPAARPWRPASPRPRRARRRRRTPPRAASSAPLPSRASVRSETGSPRRRGGLGSDASGSTNVTFRPLAAGAHEQELVAARVVVAGDRQRQRRQEVPLDRALQRPRAEVRREALGEQELERGVVELDRPLAPAQPAPREHRLQLARRGSRASPAATAAGRRRCGRSG